MQITINLRSKTPAYVQLADQIKAAIDTGELRPDDKIPSIKQLMEQTGLAMATIQKAIKRLEDEHYVLAVSGRGTFVTAGHRQ